MLKNKKISFIIPIYNSGNLLKDCLESIRNQNYPQSSVEIITPDGGSKDNGEKVAKKYNAIVIKNPKVLAEPGFMLGAKKSSGDLITYMGADNRLSDRNWINKMIKPFKDKEIIAAYPWHKNHPKNTWLTKYFNAFTDPINHFVLGASSNPLYFYRAYKTLKKNKDYVVYNFSLENYPMLAFDQGFTIRASYKRREDTEYDDILPVLDMIKKKLQIAFVPSASNYHYTLEKGIFQFIKKMRWALDNNIAPGEMAIGFSKRKKVTNKKRQFLVYIWPIYAVSLIGPVIYTIAGLVRDKKREWLYHLPITEIMAFLVFFEIIRVKVFRQRSLASRQ